MTLAKKVNCVCTLFATNDDAQALRELDEVFCAIDAFSVKIPINQQKVFQGMLMVALNALQKKDYIRLADSLEYGIVPMLERENGDDYDAI